MMIETGINNGRSLSGSSLGSTMEDLERRFDLTDAYAQRNSLGFVTVAKRDIVPILTHLRDSLGFRHLVMLTAVDIIERGILRLVYLLHNYELVADLGVQVEIPRGEVASGGDAAGARNGAGHNGDTLRANGLESAAEVIRPYFTEMESIHHLWAQAATYQRELKEMFGVHFPGSPRVDEEFALEGWKDIPPMRRDFDTRDYSERTFFPRPGRVTHDPVEYMKKQMYPDQPESIGGGA
ncbi:MAG TPA: NADH-quinone oxidoreductase subunit C [Spirochaetia bacterium]|nr:NADH-quinone oxidoreductase subunit C [Spirochaetia bacterium]